MDIGQIGKVLAVDYGTKRLGLAITDVDRTLSFPKGFLSVVSNQDACDQLKIVCDENDVSMIVLGLPLLLDMQESFFTKKVKEFGILLHNSINIPLIYIDETLSSFEADEILEGFDKKKLKKNSLRDEISAKLILDRWLEIKK